MNHEELKAVRNFLNLDVEASAKILAADDDHPEGVTRRSWQRWEHGEFNIPEGVANKIKAFLERRAKILNYHLDRGTTEMVIPYDIAETDPLEFKLQMSVIQELYAKGRIKILIA